MLHCAATHLIHRCCTMQLNTISGATPCSYIPCGQLPATPCLLQQWKTNLASYSASSILHIFSCSASLVQVERVFTAALIQIYLSLSALGTTGLSGTDLTHGESKYGGLLISSPDVKLSELKQHMEMVILSLSLSDLWLYLTALGTAGLSVTQMYVHRM